MCVRLRGPAVPEQADGTEERADDHDRQPELRLAFSSVLGCVVEIHLVAHAADNHHASNAARSEPEEGEAGGAGAEAVEALEHHGEGREEEVEVAVDHGEMQGEHGDDRREEEQLERAQDGVLEDRGSGEVGVVFGLVERVAVLLAQIGGFAAEESGRVGFIEEGGDYRHNGGLQFVSHALF